MDNKNVFVAIALSMSVLLFWAAFFETPKKTNELSQNQEIKKNENTIAPNIDTSLKVKIISREESIQKTNRVKIENNNIIGSLSLKGGIIDDISFKNHKQNLENKKNIEFLNPPETKDGFYAETGWTSINKIKVPTKDSIWKVIGNNILTENQPITLEWNNGNGIIFKKKIELDDKFLFKITQQVENKSNKPINLYP